MSARLFLRAADSALKNALNLYLPLSWGDRGEFLTFDADGLFAIPLSFSRVERESDNSCKRWPLVFEEEEEGRKFGQSLLSMRQLIILEF